MTVSLTTEIVQISVAVSLLLAIIGCYVYVNNQLEKTRDALEKQRLATVQSCKDCRAEVDNRLAGYNGKLDKIEESIQRLQLATVSRLARIEARLSIPSEKEGSDGL